MYNVDQWNLYLEVAVAKSHVEFSTEIQEIFIKLTRTICAYAVAIG